MQVIRSSSSIRRSATSFVNSIPVNFHHNPSTQLTLIRPRRISLNMCLASERSTPIGISRLSFESTFSDELPADPDTTNTPRAVRNAAFSFVSPTHPSDDDVASAWRGAVSAGHVSPPPRGDPVLQKALIAWSPACAKLFDLSDGYPSLDEESSVIDVLGGFGPLWPGMRSYAMCYGGHQFGNWADQLGDGRAISLGEYVNKSGDRWEIQLKGAGKTPYSRFADGRAVLRSSIREFLCSEAMHFLGVPSTRALSLVSTGSGVIRDMFYEGNPLMEAGAVVARVAPTFLRLGNFQLASYRGDISLVRATADYAIKWHFPHLEQYSAGSHTDGQLKYAAFLREVAQRNAEMVAQWQGIGFVHGVMNTDNFSILGLTIDYGPYGFLDAYDPNYTPNTTDIPGRRYKFSTQPLVAQWNIMQFANCMMPLCGEAAAMEVVSDFEAMYNTAYHNVMSNKLGLAKWMDGDKKLVNALLELMQNSNADFTNTWRALSQIDSMSTSSELEAWCESLRLFSSDSVRKSWIKWLETYQSRLQEDDGQLPNEERIAIMNRANPVYILRNYLAQTAIELAEKGDYSEVRNLYNLLQRPYESQEGMERYTNQPPGWASRKGVCVNSCSS